MSSSPDRSKSWAAQPNAQGRSWEADQAAAVTLRSLQKLRSHRVSAAAKMAQDMVPTVSDLAEVYGLQGVPAAQERYARITDAFEAKFGAKPQLFARSPGRVNLIGEHIDYEGYGVLPMAIRQDTVVGLRQQGDTLVITNTNSSKYPDKSFSVDPKQAVDMDNHSWANYFLAAYKGVFEFLEKQGKAPSPIGMQVVIDGQVPTGSGLSSSAALTCSVSLALLALFGVPATKNDVAEFTTTCERYVGTESGGMDQAISLMGMPMMAKLVEFNPVRAADVKLPEGATFVIANSLAVSNKAETAATRYNMRVVECRLATAVLANLLGQPKGKAAQLSTLKELEPLLQPKDGSVVRAAAEAARKYLHKEPYEQAEIEGLLETPLATIFKDNASAQRSIPLAADAGGFFLQQRALHVFAEAERVLKFRDVCNSSDLGQEEKLQRLGQLMDESQTSCRELYQCSCPELDSLIAVAKKAGSLGSRLTGAGWGGCTVSLVKQEQAASFITELKGQYYQDCIKDGKVAADGLEDVIFASKPASGGTIIKLQS